MRGVFLAWHAMEFRTPDAVRADFWGWGRYAPTAGRVIANRDLRLVSADASSAVKKAKDLLEAQALGEASPLVADGLATWMLREWTELEL